MADQILQFRQAAALKRRSLVTPEGVDLSLRLADGGQRVAAFVLDFLIMSGILILLVIVCLVGAFSMGRGGGEAALVVLVLGFFILRNGYFIIMEMGPRAATFGKRTTGLRVVARNGARLTADSVIARNLMREIELYLPLSFLSYNAAQGTADGLMAMLGFGWTAIFLFFPFFNKDRLRVGDLLAGTWVVSAPKRKLGLELLGEERIHDEFRFSEEQLDVYGVFELQTLEQVLRDSNPEAMATVAWTIRNKIGAPYAGSDHEFLMAYYEAARARMERDLLFGKRREHKHDR